jgi:hypothetical protein
VEAVALLRRIVGVEAAPTDTAVSIPSLRMTATARAGTPNSP